MMDMLQVTAALRGLPTSPRTAEDFAALAGELRTLVAGLRALRPVPQLPPPADMSGGLHVRGYASRWTPDSRGDCRQRGDFARHLARYLATGGALTLSHDGRYPLGCVVAAWEEDAGLVVDALVYPAIDEDRQTIIDALGVGLIGGLSWVGLVGDPRNVCLYEVCLTSHPGHPDATITLVQPL